MKKPKVLTTSDRSGNFNISTFGVKISVVMQLPWFKRIGLFIIPITVAGWLILVTVLVYTGYSFIEIDSRSHSVSDTLRP